MLGVMEYGVGVIRRSMGSLVWLMGIVGMNFGTSQRALNMASSTSGGRRGHPGNPFYP